MNNQIHRIGLNKTSRYTANCYCKVTIYYDITVTAFLCVCWYQEKNVDVANTTLFLLCSQNHNNDDGK